MSSKITDLPAASSVALADITTIVQGGANKQATVRVNNTGATFPTVINIGEVGVAGGKINLKGLLSGTVTLGVNGVAGTWVLLLPSADGTAGQVLATNGSGALSFTSAGSGTVTSVATAGLATGGPITGTGTITVTAATQANMEAATSTTTAVTPSVVKYHPGVAKAFARWDMTGTPAFSVSYNAASITDNGVGDQTLNLTTAFSSAANHCPLVSSSKAVARVQTGSITASAVEVITQTAAFANSDASEVMVVCYGDQ